MPDRLLINPYNQLCPNFEAPWFQAIRDAALVGNPDANPVADLAAAWRDGNDQLKLQWDAQVAADKELHRQQGLLNNPGELPQQPHPGIPDAPQPPAIIPPIGILPAGLGAMPNMQFTKGKLVDLLSDQVCVYARNRLKNGLHVDLYYFTKEGLRLTKTSNTSIGDENALSFVSTDQGLQLRPFNETKAYKNIIPDENLSWEEITEARYLFLSEIEAVCWEPEVVTAHHAFFYNLDSSDVRRREHGGRILAQYQADV